MPFNRQGILSTIVSLDPGVVNGYLARIIPCDAYEHPYGTAKKKRPGYLVGNLVATNWPIEKALHAIGYNQIPTK